MTHHLALSFSKGYLLLTLYYWLKAIEKICNLGGTEIFHMTGVRICLIPLSLTTTYRVCTGYLPEEVNCHILAMLNATSNLHNLVPQIHSPTIYCPLKGEPEVEAIPSLPHSTTLFINNGINFP
jgi:hypothetical protein